MSNKVKAKVLAGFVIEPGKDATVGTTVSLTKRQFKTLEHRGKVVEADSKDAKAAEAEAKKAEKEAAKKAEANAKAAEKESKK